MTKPARKVEIARLREEGAAAAREGRTESFMPRLYLGTMDAHHWRDGFYAAIDAMSEEDNNA